MLARIVDGAVVEMRDLALEDVPLHKRAMWLPVVNEGEGPTIDVLVEPTQVRIVRSTPAVTQADYAAAIQTHIDNTARGRGYADGVALASYRASTVPTWAAEAAAFVLWRDTVWLYAYTQLEAVSLGQRAQPTLAGIVDELPAIVWPG